MSASASSNKVRVAVIGAGWFAAQNHIPVLQGRDDVFLDGVCRLGAADLASVRDHFGFAFASEDFREVLARKPDAVVVASPHHLHHEHARAALEAGAHVLCEKPMTLDPADAWDLVATAERTGRHLLVANGYHYLPRLEEVRQAIREGAVGRIQHVLCHFASATLPVFQGSTGFRRWQTTFFRPAITTWQDPAQGGGFAYGQLSHSIALLLWLTDLRARDVMARVRGEGGIDLYDAATVTFDGGAIGVISGAPSVPEEGQARLRLSISGDAGILDLDVDLDRCVIERHDGGRLAISPAPASWRYGCDGPVHRLIELARGEIRENLSPGPVGARSVELIAAMLRSAAAQGTVAAIA
jgi:predicted dehydrogenase